MCLDVRSSREKLSHQRPRIVQVLLENYPNNSSNICIALEMRRAKIASFCSWSCMYLQKPKQVKQRMKIDSSCNKIERVRV